MLVAITGLFAATSVLADSGSADSNIITVDTRGVSVGTVTGTVLGNGAALANASVRVETTPFVTNTMSDGTFMLTNIPAGNGYVLDASAADYNSKRLTSVSVAVGSNNLGNISLVNASGPYRLMPMVPDVNPTTATVEASGTAYRYYRVLNSSGSPAGGIVVSAQIVGGSAISQTGDVSSYWPGQTAGISDADGVVRISIPASALAADGTVQTVQLSASGQVQQTFQAQVLPRQYDQVWKQKLGGGGSVEFLPLVSVEGDTSAESDLCRTLIGGALTGETISRIQTVKLGLTAGFDVGSSLSVSTPSSAISFGNEASAQAGVFGATVLRSTYTFDPNSTDPGQNAMKLYVDLGNVMSGAPGPQAGFYRFVQATIEPLFLNSNLRSVEGDVEVGGDFSGQVTLNSPLAGPVGINFDGGLSADAERIFGAAATSGGNEESATINGAAASGSAMASAGLGLNLGGPATVTPNDLSFGWNTSADVKVLTKKWTRQGSSGPYRTEQMRKLSLDAQTQNPVAMWQQYDPQALYGNYQRDFTERQEQTNGNTFVNYEWSVYAAQQNFTFNLNLNLEALGINLQGEVDQGADAVNQRGAILQSRYWPTESYPAITNSIFPSQSWDSILSQWGDYAAGPIGQGINQVITAVNNAGNTVVHVAQQTGQTAYNAVLNVSQGAMAGGAQLYSSVSSRFTSTFGTLSPLIRVRPLDAGSGNTSTYLPSDGTSNFVYGIGGIYRFASSNSFNGTAILSITYSDADVVGLNPTNLQIYQLPDGTSRWQLIGGTVDTVSNTVTATITSLGTYAIAPPLPTGALQLIPSMIVLPADGTSQMTVTLTNLMLNTGNAATQQWLFTATAIGAQILNPDCDTNLPGIQVVSSNAVLSLLLQAPSGGTVAQISLASVAGDAFGSLEINLNDTNPPATPTNVIVTAGQSRIWVTWTTNSEPDLAGYRVYYRSGQNGPPYDGNAAVEGSPSPVQITGTNYCLLRGLTLGTNYFVAVSAVDTTGNESPLSPAVQLTTTESPPTPPTDVAVRFGSDRTNVLMWALSEDDGYNDRDVAQYYIWRAVLPGGSYIQVAQVPAGVGVYTETNPVLAPTQSLSYAVSVVDSSNMSSAQVVATTILPPSVVSSNLVIGSCQMLPGSKFQLSVSGGMIGQSYVLLASTNLVNWVPAWVYVSTNSPMMLYDPMASNFQHRFYKIGPLTSFPSMSLGLAASNAFGDNGLNLMLYSLPGLNYRIEVSSNLVNWTTLTNFVKTNSPFQFSDPAATNYTRRFYRAVIP